MTKNIAIFAMAFYGTMTCGNAFAVSPYANTIKQNIAPKSFLTVASFPQTAADATFIERVQSKAEGYSYFNRSAFSDMSIEEQDELESMAYRAELQRLRALIYDTHDDYCHNYPMADGCPGALTDATPQQPQTTQPESIYQTTTPTTTNYMYTPYMRAALTAENINKYGLSTHNGECTPPERSNHWKNQILTSGYYQHTAPAFEKFMITAFRKEGGCVNDPDDRGGYTCYGCASNGLCRGVDFNTISRGKVENLAYSNIYTKYNIDKLPDAFRGYALWGMWGSGAITGIKQFQSTLGVQTTGKIDDATIRAAETYTGDFADAYTNNREQFLRNIVARDPKQKKFLNGWLRGLELLRPSGCHVVPTNPIYR